MANTEAIAVQRVPALTPEVQAQLQQLVVHSHWNQLPADWAQFFQLGTVHAVRDAGCAITASGAVLPMGAPTAPGPPVSWISMILVSPAQRGCGLGRAVFASCLAQVLADHRVPMLDATPQGEALYAKFGFEPQWRFTRWRRARQEAVTGGALPMANGVDHLLRLDAQALGFERAALLRGLAAREGAMCLRLGDATALLRPGRTATQIGPMHAHDEADGAALLDAIAAARPEALVIDVPQGRPRMEARLQAAGFTPERPFARMVRHAGHALAPAHTAIVQAVAGPEYA
ncbi:MAG: GNAT family N-acetyltransferase [Hydrogenophaga sp.]|jgi:GNAT superfamily N-acetyltransferase|uniref:GNAT family N-acetyltransferase n=1 Tax=Hydrogenophaga sp. TaxID=1904254 RepID=UPI001D753D4D|nr:GNAT family N-acetyltransferase [Hydrogenophaga sp.]MBW0169483.1 GNAT family N-acetyltransferase [Hydrogenophaga sp.]MBW0183910.1 GNAT family N-acetyltransferase [Hydrogenophaga sp.]